MKFGLTYYKTDFPLMFNLKKFRSCTYEEKIDMIKLLVYQYNQLKSESAIIKDGIEVLVEDLK